MKGTQAIGRFLKKHGPLILSALASGGVIGTAYLAVRGSKKSANKQAEAAVKKGEPLTKKEQLVVSAPAYIPALTLGGITIACIIGSNAMSRSQQAALIGALALVEKRYQDYKNKVVETVGEIEEANISREIAKDNVIATRQRAFDLGSGEKLLFFEELSGEYFEATEAEVLYAEYHFNRNFVLAGHALLNQLYDWYGLPHTKAGEVMGWNLYDGECFYGYRWVDFQHDKVTLDDGLEVYVISMPFAPHANYEEEY